MPFYNRINQHSSQGKRTLEKLLLLRTHLDKEIPQRNLESSIIVATWNIREFDSAAFGDRLDESFYYIAEIVNRFDLVAIQEVRKKVDALDRLKEILGSSWEYLLTDVTEGRRGNRERMAFLYDTRKIRFGGLAGEVVFPPMRVKNEQGESIYQEVTQLARTPFVAGFHAGWTSFMLTTVHILYGKSKAEDPRRIAEIEHIANFLSKRTTDPAAWSKNSILLGDFNIFKPKDKTYQALLESGFIIPEELQKLPSNVNQDKYYDQIAFKVREDRFSTTGKAGVFNFFETVFTSDEESLYGPQIGARYLKSKKGKERTEAEKRRYYNMWRSHQISDHLPMWVEIKIDYSSEYLKNKLSSAEFAEINTPSDFSRSLSVTSQILGPDEKEQAALVFNTGVAAYETFQKTSYVAQDFSEVQMSAQDLSGKNFSHADFKRATLVETSFEDATLNEASFFEAQLNSADFSYADAIGAKFIFANLQKALFIETDLTQADFSGADLRDATFFECELRGATFRGTLLSMGLKEQLQELGIDLSGAEFFF